ncbi:unnamed protein product, partial [Porites evermanni]
MVLAATIDRVASDALAKVEEKCPVIAKPPNEIKAKVTDTASGYYNKLKNHSAVKMMSVKSKTLSTFTEIPAEAALPPYSTNEEDTQETESDGDHHGKGALCRVQNLGEKVSRREMKKQMAIMPTKLTGFGGEATDVVGESSGADKNVLSSTNYIPNMTTILSGGEIASAKGIIPDISKCCPWQRKIAEKK